ncbi:TraX family protein [Leptolyngbya ohadii]|uniref:TraX family protein n=1 Tax=Leptolyngbya ohadii TaxID=1962290 RepID=UPI000B5A0A61|nr:TraX family protein [Leptolyngbya ohadii]
MPRSLNSYQLKLLAALLMVIDHVGVVFFPGVEVLRFIGRFSFPLFCWLLVQGEAHTRNFWAYLIRLLIMGIITQPIYNTVLLNGANDQYNILFTLAIGLVCLRIARFNRWLQIPAWIAGAALAQVIPVDYSYYGIAIIALIRYFEPTGLWWTAWLLIHFALVLAEPGWGISQAPAIAAPVFFMLANGERGKRARWFYWFYPGHIAVLFVIQHLIPRVS